MEQAFRRLTKASTSTHMRKFEIGVPLRKGDTGPKIDRIHKRPQTANAGGARFFSDVKKTAIQPRGSNNPNVNPFPTASEETDPSIQLQGTSFFDIFSERSTVLGSRMKIETKADYFNELQYQEPQIIEKQQPMGVQTHYMWDENVQQNVLSSNVVSVNVSS